MKIEEKKVKIKDLLNLNQALSILSNQPLELEVRIDIGIAISDIQEALLEYNTKSDLIKSEVLKSNLNKDRDILLFEINNKIIEKLSFLLEREITINIPIFSKLDFIRYKENDINFNPEVRFYTLIRKFIEDEHV